MNIEIFLSKRYLSGIKGRGLSVITWIALLGVIVGVMSLVTVMAVMSGFDHELRSKILGNNAHIVVGLKSKSSEEDRTSDEVMALIRGHDSISSAMFVIYGEAFALSNSGASEGISLRGVDPQEVQSVLDLRDYVEKGDWSGLKSGGIILGDSLAARLGVDIGDSITLLLNRGQFSPLGIVPRMRKLQIVDTFHSGMTQFDSYHGYVSLDVARELFDSVPRTIEIRTTDVRRLSSITEELRETIPEAFFVQDWLAQNKDFLSALRLEKTAMAVILALIILVAALNICGSLIMTVRDKTRDIAILKSMGATDGLVLRIFFLQGVFIGAVGTVVGVLLGILLSLLLRDWIRFPLDKEVYMIDTVPVDLRISDIGFVVLGAFFISALATYYPARLAAKINPTEGLKVDS